MIPRSFRYKVVIEYSEEDQEFVATVPELPGCSALASCRGAALFEIEHAIPAWLEACQKAGNPIPEPIHATR